MKALKPSMKENKRYLMIQGKNLKKNIPLSIKDYIGILGMSRVALNFIEEKKDWVVVQINREMIDKVRAAVCIWPEKMEVLKVSGTLKALKY